MTAYKEKRKPWESHQGLESWTGAKLRCKLYSESQCSKNILQRCGYPVLSRYHQTFTWESARLSFMWTRMRWVLLIPRFQLLKSILQNLSEKPMLNVTRHCQITLLIHGVEAWKFVCISKWNHEGYSRCPGLVPDPQFYANGMAGVVCLSFIKELSKSMRKKCHWRLERISNACLSHTFHNWLTKVSVLSDNIYCFPVLFSFCPFPIVAMPMSSDNQKP